MGITIGADPELFVTDGESIVSAIGLVGGTKLKPIPVTDGAIQEDNVLAEFNIEPCFNSAEFVGRINNVVDQLHKRLPQGHGTVVQSSHNFDIDVLLSDPKALEFGCDPDYDCWTKNINPSPRPDTLLRTAGGHVHIGYDNPDTETSFKIAQMCDILLGIPSVLLDSDKCRRTLYGKSGACRVKPYGVEYRTLSNFWLANDTLKSWVFDAATRAVSDIGMLDYVLSEFPKEEIRVIIDTSDTKGAVSFVKQFNIKVPDYEHAIAI